MILQVREPTFSVGRQSVLHVAACSPSLSARSREARCSGRSGTRWWLDGWTTEGEAWKMPSFLETWEKRKRKCMNMLDFTPHSRNMSYMWSSTEVHNWSMLKAAHKLKVWILWSWTLMCFFPRTVSCNIICFGCPGWWKCSTYHDVLQDVYYITIRIPTPQKLFFWGPKNTPAIQVQTPPLEGPRILRGYYLNIHIIIHRISCKTRAEVINADLVLWMFGGCQKIISFRGRSRHTHRAQPINCKWLK